MMMSTQRSHHVRGCRSSTLVANGGVHVGVCGTWDSVVVLYRGCYRDLLLVMQRIYRAGYDGVSATVTSREGGCRNSTLVANGGVHVGVCGTCDQPAKKL